jgi:hypothetical protein
MYGKPFLCFTFYYLLFPGMVKIKIKCEAVEKIQKKIFPNPFLPFFFGGKK